MALATGIALATGMGYMVEDIIPDVLLRAIIFESGSKSEKNILSLSHKDTEGRI